MNRWIIKAGGYSLRPLLCRSLLRTVNVAYYHYVGPQEPHNAAFYDGCTTDKFAEDLRSLTRMFDCLSLREVLDDTPSQSRRRRPTLAITFDDGFDLRKHGAMEILERAGIKATTFVLTAMIGNGMLMWRCMLSVIQTQVPEPVWRAQYSELAANHGFAPLPANQSLMDATARQWEMARKDELAAELWKRCNLPPVEQYLAENKPYFDWEGLQDWLKAGHSVGFHTHTHPFCSKLTARDIQTELVQPAIQLKQRLGLDRLWLSYPFGDRLASPAEQGLFETGPFSAIFGTEGFSKRGSSKARLERLALEGFFVEEQILRERLWAIRRRLFSSGSD